MTAQEHPDPPPVRVRADLTINAVGRPCPMPVIMLAERIQEVRAGDTIEVLADDPAVLSDLPGWCQLRSHRLLRQEKRSAGWSFLIRREH
jgi:tRNA 2-thiouridine synthesizing protein A